MPKQKPAELSHVAADGSISMVDVGSKAETRRLARAGGRITMSADTLKQIAAYLSEGMAVSAPAPVPAAVAGVRSSSLPEEPCVITRLVPDSEWVASILPPRPPDAHKGTFGMALLAGAVLLALSSACGDTAASFLSCGAIRAGTCVDVAGTASVFAATTTPSRSSNSAMSGCTSSRPWTSTRRRPGSSPSSAPGEGSRRPRRACRRSWRAARNAPSAAGPERRPPSGRPWSAPA